MKKTFTTARKKAEDLLQAKGQTPFGEAIYNIIGLYKGDNTEPLDGDEVDVMVEHLRNEINLFEGNITTEEYCDYEEQMRLNPTF